MFTWRFVHKYSHQHIIITASNWKQLDSPLAGEWINKLWYWHSRTVLSKKTEWTAEKTCGNTGEPQKHWAEPRPDKVCTFYDSIEHVKVNLSDRRTSATVWGPMRWAWEDTQLYAVMWIFSIHSLHLVKSLCTLHKALEVPLNTGTVKWHRAFKTRQLMLVTRL